MSLPKCNACNSARKVKAAVLNGQFGNYCERCIAKADRHMSPAAVQGQRDQDYADNKRDLIQPYGRHGHPNAEFIKEYPEQAKEIFNDEELEKFQ